MNTAGGMRFSKPPTHATRTNRPRNSDRIVARGSRGRDLEGNTILTQLTARPLRPLVQYEEIENLNELTGRKLHEYRLWRQNDGNLAPASEKIQMDTIRVFVKWLESVDAVDTDLHTKVRSPTLRDGENVRNVIHIES